MKFSGRHRNNYMQGPSQLSTPLYSQLTLGIYVCCHKLAGLGHPNIGIAREAMGSQNVWHEL